MNPEIRGFSLGPFQTNCYVVTCRGESGADRCWVVDCGFFPGVLLEHLRERSLVPEAVILTHAHCDHIAGLGDLRDVFPTVPIWVHRAERDWLTDPELNLSAKYGFGIVVPAAERLLDGGEVLTLGASTWEVVHTPGHSPGGITLVHAGSRRAIVGDTLFAGGVGRYDFPGSDGEVLAASIRLRLYTLPDETRIYPGHGPETTVGEEKQTNPYIRG